MDLSNQFIANLLTIVWVKIGQMLIILWSETWYLIFSIGPPCRYI